MNTTTDNEIRDPYLNLLNKRCAVYIPEKTYFGTLKRVTDKELVFEDNQGRVAIYPRGSYDVKEARPKDNGYNEYNNHD